MAKIIDETGKRFGRLTVIKKAEKSRDTGAAWVCKCDCGNVVTVHGKELRNGDARSCGCIRKENTAELGKRKDRKTRKTHGQSNTRLHEVWQGMKQRCKNPNHKAFNRYGGRGIKVCEEWETYENFEAWARKTGYKEDAKVGECTLDRIDNDGDYSPNNCRWASMKEQCRNREKARR